MKFIILATILCVAFVQSTTPKCDPPVNCLVNWTKEQCAAQNKQWVPATSCSCSSCVDCDAEVACFLTPSQAQCAAQGKVVIPKSKCECAYCGPESAVPSSA